jgi:sugar phosphate isomerase/epimerase
MQLGISTYTYGWAFGAKGSDYQHKLNENHLLEKAKEFGLSLIQIGDNLPLHNFEPERLRKLATSLKEQAIAIEIGARGLTSEHLDRYINIALQLQAKLIRFVIDDENYEPDLPTVTGIIQNALHTLDKQGIKLGIENHDRLKAVEFAKIIETINSPNVGICLDSVNSMGAGEGLEQVVDILAPYTVNLHIKDFGIQRLPHLMGFVIDGRPAGKGMLNVPWLLEKLEPFGRCRTAILEQWVPAENYMTSNIKKEAIWAEESIQYLKNYF